MKELLTLSLTGIFTMLADMFNLRKLVFPLALLGLAMTISWSVYDWNLSQRIWGMMQMDNFALGFTIALSSIALLWLLMSEEYFSTMKAITDRYSLMFFALTGGLVMVSYTNMVMLFLGIEILSVSLYVLAGSNKTDLSSNESAFKYFLMGSFASGFLLFGIALIYGITGSFNLLEIRASLGKLPDTSLLNVGMIMLIIGMGFKIGAAPFHFWTPDVYQGAPTPITAFMATAVKTAAVAAMCRLFVSYFPLVSGVWLDIFAVLIIMSLLLGNIIAVMQHDAKRLLAFSSISHAGYMMMTIFSVDSESNNSLLFYTVVYAIGSIAAFMVVYLIQKNKGTASISAFNGLAKKSPLLAISMTVALLSMAGIPPLAGFMAKYYVFVNVLQDGYLSMVLFAIAMSLVGVYYYFKIIIAMFLHEDTEGGEVKADALQTLLLIIVSAALLLLGVLPNLVYNLL
ncbi:MAG: NADH-quinone oxidoreductase subunit N [Saprospiraceae bacterium]|nr:NADH-quinone oxidoreductase subunit N [Saprospiraceae bacterium]